MTALPQRPLVSVDEYLQLDRASRETRYEYIDGRVTMMAGGSLDHAAIGANVISILRGLLRGGSCRVFSSDARVQLSETRYVYPDVSVSCHEQDRGPQDAVLYPRLVVEVLSPSTEGFDRGLKFSCYRECPSIQEYLLIDSQRFSVELYRREKNDFWLLRAYRLDEYIELPNLGIRFLCSTIYEDIRFPSQDEGPPAV